LQQIGKFWKLVLATSWPLLKVVKRSTKSC
jgi:hypothetical protein